MHCTTQFQPYYGRIPNALPSTIWLQKWTEQWYEKMNTRIVLPVKLDNVTPK